MGEKGTKDKNKNRDGRHRGIRILTAVIGALLLGTGLLAIRLFWPITGPAPDPKPEASGWMADIDGGRLLSEINLPGTHDSGTQFVDIAYFCQCQTYDIGTQLELGYRLLDMRLTEGGGGDINICHGGYLCRTGPFPWSEALGLEQALGWCYAFLENNPTETVVFMVKNESGSRSDEEMRDMLFRYIERQPESWYLGNRVPALDEVRGKLVLANRMTDEEGNVSGGLAFLWENQGNKDPSGDPVALADVNEETVLHVQDRYCFDREDKWKAVAETLESSAQSEASAGGKSHIYLNYLSTKGRAPVGHPYYYAKELNRRLLGHELTEGEKCGWVVVDFGTGELAEHIYGIN